MERGPARDGLCEVRGNPLDAGDGFKGLSKGFVAGIDVEALDTSGQKDFDFVSDECFTEGSPGAVVKRPPLLCLIIEAFGRVKDNLVT